MATPSSTQAMAEALRTMQFIRNKCTCMWMDGHGVSNNDLQMHCAVLAKEFPFAECLNSQARQASAKRAWFAIARFYEHSKNKKLGRRAIRNFSMIIAVLSMSKPDGKHIVFTDGCGSGVMVKKALSVRTHICPSCGVVLDRDHNATKIILQKALSPDRGCTMGHTEAGRLAPSNASGNRTSTA